VDCGRLPQVDLTHVNTHRFDPSVTKGLDQLGDNSISLRGDEVELDPRQVVLLDQGRQDVQFDGSREGPVSIVKTPASTAPLRAPIVPSDPNLSW
jgi:hypothetical protein